MTKTLKLLRLLSDGKARTVAEIATECAFTMDEAHRTLQSIRKRKATRSLGTPYMLTPVGMALLHEREAKRVRVEKVAGKRGRPRIHSVAEASQTAPIPSVQTQPAIQQVWR